MKVEEFKKLMLKKPKKNKYGAEKTTFMGLKFDSKGEANRYGELVILERMGHIQNLKRQVSFELAPSVKFSGESKAKPALRYMADFLYFKDGKKVVEDFKSEATKTEVFRMKQHLMLSVHGIEIKLSKACT